MTASAYFRLLYLGRQTTLPQTIEAIWQNARAADPVAAPFSLRIVRVTSQAQAMDALRAHLCQAILLDVGNERQNRARFCAGLRRRFPELRILALWDQPLRVKSFAFDGALCLPLCPSETQRVLRSTFRTDDETILRLGPIQLDSTTRTLQGPRGRHQLPPKQAGLLRLLMVHAGEVVSRKTIMRIVWETEYLADTRTIDVHVRWLREKIEPDPSNPAHLITVRGHGYRLAF